MSQTQPSSLSATSRRGFLKTSTALAVAGTLAGTLGSARMAHAGGSETLSVGLVGCGGRGSGAAVNACNADPNVKLTALADLFPDAVNNAANNLKNNLGDKYAVTDDQKFHGFDAYKQIMQTDIDVVLLCTPPHFRPLHMQAAVEAGKHMFVEKPVAVDGPGCRLMFDLVRQADEKKLNVVSGLCWRYDYGVRETMKRIQDGAIGDVLAVQENYLAGTLWQRPRQPGWSEMEYQLRNWLYYTWLSGDHNTEQHVHSLDKGLWLMGDVPPVRCFGLGGRQVRTDAKFGHIYDHHAVCYEFPNERKVFAYTRQMAGCHTDVEDYVIGTKGNAAVLRNEVAGEERWRYRGPKPSMYDVEHQELMAAIRAGTPINNGEYMTNSTLMAIMGRMATYTGQMISWEAALNSKEDLTPERYEFGDVKIPEVAMPGITPFA